MWEFCIVADRENCHLLEMLSDGLICDLKAFHGIQTLANTPKGSTLVMACKKQNLPQFLAKLKVILTNVICKQMKFDYLKSHMNFNKLNDVFITVFTYFDLALEQSLVQENLIFPKKLKLESFVEFRLSFLKKKWKELCHLTLSSEKILENETNCRELLKFLLLNLDIKTQILVLNFKTGKAYIEGEICSFQTSVLGADKLQIFQILIEHYPITLKIIKSKKNKQLQQFLVSVFDKNTIIY